MWIFTQSGFYSAVEAPGGGIVVGARQPGDLETLREAMPGLSEVTIIPGRDYRYRAFASREDFAAGMAEVARRIDYGNLKSRVDRSGSSRFGDACHRVWGVVEKIQPGGAYGVDDRAGYPPIPAGKAGDGTREGAVRS